jgi:hypothetical protein
MKRKRKLIAGVTLATTSVIAPSVARYGFPEVVHGSMVGAVTAVSFVAWTIASVILITFRDGDK